MKKDSLYLTEQEMKMLSLVALGKEKADLAVINTCLVNVYTGEILDNQCVSIKGRRIALVDQDISNTIGRNTKVIDGKGKTLIPGLIDGHTHTAVWFTIYEFLKHAMKGGTTTIITETMEIFPVAGYDGVIDFLKSLKDQPIKMLATAPALASISQTLSGLPPKVMQKLIDREDIVGIGESYWQAVFQSPERFLLNFETVLQKGKMVEGHSAGARGKKLSAYAAMGISSCHEPITAEETLERLRLGLYVMVREGSIRRDLASISKIKDKNINLRRLILTTDGISPTDLLNLGYMEYLVQKAIDCDFHPVTAIQMATLNVAEHFGLDHAIGGIAPGKMADMVIIPNPETIRSEYVISNGRMIAQNGKLSALPRPHHYSRESLNTVKLPNKLQADDFKIDLPKDQEHPKVRIIDMVTDLVTREIIEKISVVENEITLDNINLSKIAAIDRAKRPGKIFTGLLKGFKIKSGAVACSAAWDTSCIIVIGKNESDMAFAVNRIHQLKGGVVICDNEEILNELALPVFGIISELPVEKIADHLEKINTTLKKSGVDFSDPLLTLITLTGAAIPYLRICEEGLVNFKDGKILDLFTSISS
ncbi:MAG: adenine deaminase [Desulfobacterales bacterium]|nr:adenine deaminase [Desulfobacterales bacterium]